MHYLLDEGWKEGRKEGRRIKSAWSQGRDGRWVALGFYRRGRFGQGTLTQGISFFRGFDSRDGGKQCVRKVWLFCMMDE